MSSAQPPPDRQTSARVLLIEDSPRVRELMAGQLAAWGYDVDTADSGSSGIATLEARGADVVVTDIVMSDMSGTRLLEHVRGSCPDVPVIMLSLPSQLEAVLDAVRLGAFDYVTKDARTEALRAALQRATNQIWLKRENARLLDELHRINLELEDRVERRARMLREANQRLQRERQELQRTLSQLHETQSQLVHAEKMATVGLLTAGVAHEINAPLGFVLPNFTILQHWFESIVSGERAQPSDSAGEMLDLIREMKVALMRIRDIVHELGLFSRRSSSRRERVELQQVVDSVVTLFGSQFRERARLDVALGDVPSVWGDPSQLRQVFLNLVVEAVQATPPTTAEGLIQISGRPVGSHVEVTVSHNGEPLSAELVDRILDPVFASQHPSQGGHAGLAISRHLVERMGGMVQLDAERHGGRTVLIRLPCWTERSEAAQAEEAKPLGKSTIRLEHEELG